MRLATGGCAYRLARVDGDITHAPTMGMNRYNAAIAHLRYVRADSFLRAHQKERCVAWDRRTSGELAAVERRGVKKAQRSRGIAVTWATSAALPSLKASARTCLCAAWLYGVALRLWVFFFFLSANESLAGNTWPGYS